MTVLPEPPPVDWMFETINLITSAITHVPIAK